MGFSNIGEGGQTQRPAWGGGRSDPGLVNEDGERRAKPLEPLVITQERSEKNTSVIPDKMENSENPDGVANTLVTGFKAIRAGDNEAIQGQVVAPS